MADGENGLPHGLPQWLRTKNCRHKFVASITVLHPRFCQADAYIDIVQGIFAFFLGLIKIGDNGDCYLLRIQPYRTLDNIIEGVVLTFTDISQRIKAEAAVRDALAFSENIVDTVREPLLLLDKNLQIVSANRAFCQYFQVNAEDTIGRKVYDLGNRQWNIPALRELLETILPRDQSFEGYVVEHTFPVIGQRKILLNARCIDGKLGEPSLILLVIEEVSARHIEVKS